MAASRVIPQLALVVAAAIGCSSVSGECLATADVIAVVRVESCADARAAADARISEMYADDLVGGQLKASGFDRRADYTSWVLRDGGGLIVDVQIVESRRLEHVARSGTRRATAWKKSGERQRLLLRGTVAGSCEALTGDDETSTLFISDTCCDTIPASEPACLLELKTASAIPEWVRAAGYDRLK